MHEFVHCTYYILYNLMLLGIIYITLLLIKINNMNQKSIKNYNNFETINMTILIKNIFYKSTITTI